jgi:ElaB/YqjD/DUF883 family membrane-anchored ribosome-binding protein
MFTLTKSDTAKKDRHGKGADTNHLHRLRHFIDHATHDARDTLAATQRQVREHPLRTGAVAAGIGFLLGVLLRRR